MPGTGRRACHDSPPARPRRGAPRKCPHETANGSGLHAGSGLCPAFAPPDLGRKELWVRLNTCRVRTGGRRTGEGHGRGTHRLTRARARAGGRGAANEYVLTPRGCHPSCRPASGGERHRTPPVRERLPSGCRRHRRLGLAHVERLPTSATNGSASGRRASQAEHIFSFWRRQVEKRRGRALRDRLCRRGPPS